MIGNQDSPPVGRDDLQRMLSDLACIAGTLSEIATVWRRARSYRPGLPVLVPEQLADAARQLARDIQSPAAGRLGPHDQAVSVAERYSALEQGIASAQAMTRGSDAPDLGDVRLWVSLRGPVARAARQITELASELVTTD